MSTTNQSNIVYSPRYSATACAGKCRRSRLPDAWVPLCVGFPTASGLCGRPLSLAAISLAVSPHSKIPLLADKVRG